jgi:hypothetical protein
MFRACRVFPSLRGLPLKATTFMLQSSLLVRVECDFLVMDHPFMQTVVAILGGMALGINYEGVRGTWQGARGIPPASCAEATSPVCSAVEGVEMTTEN